jgi:hypothetical protein
MTQLILPKLDHSQKDLAKAFGLTNYEKLYARTAVVFETLSLHMLTKKLFDKVDDAPDNMTTMTGILEHAMEHMKTPEQRAYLLVIFIESTEKVARAINSYGENAEKADTSSLEGTLKHLISQLEILPIKKSIDVISEVNHDFDAFVAKMLPKDKVDAMENDDIPDDIKEMIRKALEDDEDNS